ncbi:MAG: cupin domain-containing protein [Anaerolineae bacterium]|nr:cupin domain-containing protein [Anaerolineae bacterium]
MDFETKALPEKHDRVAPDQSYIRLLPTLDRGGLVHCTLEPGTVSWAVAHKTVEELWYCLEGTGEMWRRHGDVQTTVELRPGISLTIPTGTHFQFRNTGTTPLCVLITTMPPWPGAEEAYRVDDFWPVNED